MATTAQVYQLYLAYFGRPPDFTGLNSFANSTPAQVQAIFSASAESRALLGSTDTATQVNNIYQNLFGRNAEIAGLAYWVSEIASGRVTLASAAFDILNGARNADATVVANRIEVAQAFVANYSATTAGILGYVGDAAAAQARTFLRTVTDTAASKTAALAGVSAAVAATTATGGQITGSNFTLTTAIDSGAAFTGTSGNDSYSALLDVSGSTLNTGDALNGGSGTDSLNITVATATTTPIVQLDGIETVSFSLLGDQGATFNMLQASGVSTVQVAANSLDDRALTVTSANVAATYKVIGDNDINVDVLDSAATSTLKLSLDGAGESTTDPAALTVKTDNNIDQISIVNTGSSFGAINATGAFNVSISGGGALWVDVGAQASAINAADFTGSSIILIRSDSRDQVITGGASADTINFGTAGHLNNSDTINGGAGSDVLVAGLSGSQLRFTNITNVETLRASATNNSAVNIEAASGDAALANFVLQGTGSFTIANVNAANTSVNVAVDSVNGVTIDMSTASNALAFSVGSASAGSIGVGGLTVTDASAVSITALSTAAAHTLGAVSFDAATKRVNITTSNDTDVSLDSLAAPGATNATITTAASASFTGTGMFAAASSLASVTLAAAGTDAADIVIGDTTRIGSTTAVSAQGFALTVSGRDSADVTLGGVTLAASVAAGAITLDAASGSQIVFGTGITGAAESSIASITGSAGESGVITLSEVSIAQTATATNGIGQITFSGASGAAITLGTASAARIAGISVSAGASTTYLQGPVQASAIGNISIAAATAGLSTISATGNIGTFTFTGSSLNAGVISASAIGNVTINAAGTATLAGLTSNADGTDIGNVRFDGGILTITGLGTATNGGGTGSIGSLSFSARNNVDINSIDAGTVGTITLSGSGSFSLGLLNSDNFRTFDASGVKGSAATTTSTTVSADFTLVTSAISVTLGASASNKIVSGQNNDTITFATGSLAVATATDTVVYSQQAQGLDQIISFEQGTGGDVIQLLVSTTAAAVTIATSDIKLVTFGDGAGAGTAIVGATGITNVANVAAAGAFDIGTADYVVLSFTSFSNANSVVEALATGGLAALNYNATGFVGLTGANVLVVWSNGQNSFVTLVDIGNADGTSPGTAIVSLANTANFVTLAELEGVSKTELASWGNGNIDFDTTT